MKTIVSLFRTSPREHWQMLKQDTVYALRMMGKNLGFTAIAVVTLALGVGVNTAIFSAVHGVMLRPLPYSHGGEIVIVEQQLPRSGIANMSFSAAEVNDYRQQSNSLSEVVEYHNMRFTLLSHGVAERVRTGVVSSRFFDALGAKPILGRSFLPSEEQPGAPPVLLLSYEYWQRSQHGDPNIVGKTFEMNDKVHTVIGVLPPMPQYPDENDIYVTTTSCPFRSAPAFIGDRDQRMMTVFGRLKSPGTFQEANSDLGVISGRLQREYPGSYPPQSGYHTVAIPLTQELTHHARPTLLVLLGAAGFVLLIACANVANFTLARLSQRDQELALRSALGAGSGRLLRQLFTESLLLGLFAAGLSLVLAVASQKLLVDFVSGLTPRASEINIDGPVLLFTLAAAVLTSVITGSSLAFFSGRRMREGLKEGPRQASVGTGGRQVRNSLIVAQVAFSFALLIGAGLMLRSFIKLQSVDLGFVSERVLTMAIDLNWSKYVTPVQQRAAAHAILDKVQLLPGVLNAAVSSSFPLDPDSVAQGAAARENRYQILGKPLREGERIPLGSVRVGTPDYFKTLGIPLIKGRTFAPGDKEDAPAVAVINQSLAQHSFSGEDPIGKRISLDEGRNWALIIGVVGNTKEFGLNEDPLDEVYLPMDQSPSVGHLVVRTATDPTILANRVRSAVTDFDPETPVTNLETLEAAREDRLSSARVITNLLGLFSGLALVIAASGIGGILALSVSQRIKEIGIRMALGAQPSDVLNMVIRQGMTLVGVGLACGLLVAFLMTGSLQTLLFHVSPVDPWTLAGVCLLLALAAFVACYIPARRATKINPLTALRHE